MKRLVQIILISFLTLFFTNCTLLKKRYSSGYKVEWHKNFNKSTDFSKENHPLEKKNTNENPFYHTEIECTPIHEHDLEKETFVVNNTLTEDVKIKSKLNKPIAFSTINKPQKLNVENEKKPINKEATLAFTLSTIAILLILTFFITLSNPILLAIAFGLLIIAFIFAINANKALTADPDKYNNISKKFILFSVIVYFLSLLALLIYPFVSIVSIVSSGFLGIILLISIISPSLTYILILLFLIAFLTFLLLTLISVRQFIKSFKQRTKKTPNNPFKK